MAVLYEAKYVVGNRMAKLGSVSLLNSYMANEGDLPLSSIFCNDTKAQHTLVEMEHLASWAQCDTEGKPGVTLSCVTAPTSKMRGGMVGDYKKDGS